MDIVIPYKADFDSFPLRMCLRSIEKHIGDIRIWIVGNDIPEWVTGVRVLPCGDDPNMGMKERNIFNKLIKAASFQNVSDRFMYMNDDHFILNQFYIHSLPYFYEDKLYDKLSKSNNTPGYQRCLYNTSKEVLGNTPYYDVHCPMIMQKDVLLAMNTALPKWPLFGYCIKTLYMNYYECVVYRKINIQIAPFKDYKIKEPSNKETVLNNLKVRTFFSIDSKPLTEDTYQVLESLYPNQSKYELTTSNRP